MRTFQQQRNIGSQIINQSARFPHRPVQIILRLYDSPAQILAGFDIDAACCAFDGEACLSQCGRCFIDNEIGRTVWVNPRSLTAVMRQSNTIDITRRSPSYELRLAKYTEQGFEIFVPSLSRTKVNPLVFFLLRKSRSPQLTL